LILERADMKKRKSESLRDSSEGNEFPTATSSTTILLKNEADRLSLSIYHVLGVVSCREGRKGWGKRGD